MPDNWRRTLLPRLTVRGFIVSVELNSADEGPSESGIERGCQN